MERPTVAEETFYTRIPHLSGILRSQEPGKPLKNTAELSEKIELNFQHLNPLFKIF